MYRSMNGTKPEIPGLYLSPIGVVKEKYAVLTTRNNSVG